MTLTPEEQAALDRLRQARRDSDECYGGYPDTRYGRVQSAVDHSYAAQIVLREHPTDDDELLDSSWLDTVTTVQNPGCYRYRAGCVTFIYESQWVAYSHGSPHYHKLVEVHTRGDVRRLCQALGIDFG